MDIGVLSIMLKGGKISEPPKQEIQHYPEIFATITFYPSSA
jgi:hypothetical protein